MQWRWSIPLTALLILGVVAPVKAQAPSPAPEMGTGTALPVEALHQVQAQDNLHLLAAYYYGDARQWVRILGTNRGAIQHPNIIHPGQILRIHLAPDWTPPEPYAAWKRRAGSRITAATGSPPAAVTQPEPAPSEPPASSVAPSEPPAPSMTPSETPEPPAPAPKEER